MTTHPTVGDKVILIRISKLYRDHMSPQELYEATRGVWKVGPRRDGADYAFAVYQGEVKEVFHIGSWHPAGTLAYLTRPRGDVEVEGRWEFEGEAADPLIRNKYIGISVKQYLPKGAVNPVIYVNC